MSDPRGMVTLKAGGQEYRLWLGMSVLAELQARHGQTFLDRMEPPEGASRAWMPDLSILIDLIVFALARYHPEADRYTADEILAENPGCYTAIMAAAFPAPDAPQGNRKARRAAAST